MGAFLQDVIDEHHGDQAAGDLNSDMQWSGGTVGTVTGSANVAGLFAGVVAAFPDAHTTIKDIFGQAGQVVVRVVVSGTQQGAILGIPATGRNVHWDGVDVYRLSMARSARSGPVMTGPPPNYTGTTRRPGSPDALGAVTRRPRHRARQHEPPDAPVVEPAPASRSRSRRSAGAAASPVARQTVLSVSPCTCTHVCTCRVKERARRRTPRQPAGPPRRRPATRAPSPGRA